MTGMRRPKDVIARVLPPLVAVGLLLGGWQMWVTHNTISPTFLPSPVRVATVLVERFDLLWDNAQVTLIETFAGFVLAVVVGLAAAILIDRSLIARRALYPLLIASQTVPIIAIAPLLVIWLGFDIWPKLIIVWLTCFFSIVVAAVDGFSSADRDATRLLQSLGASGWQIFWKLRFPSGLPNLFTGTRIAITYSVVGAIYGEYVGAERGLGIVMQRFKNSGRIDLVFAVIVLTAFISIALFLFVGLLQRLVMGWYFAQQNYERR